MKKILSVVLILVLVGNIALFSFGKINPLMFWVVIIFCAVNAYWVIPKMN